MITSPSDTYTLTLWLTGRPEKCWMELSGKEITRFEHEYTTFLKSNQPRAVYVMDFEDKKRTVRLDMLTDFSIIPNTD
ncbi:MAG: hypothetical protein JWN14_4249 [Chthonomonadales bacterium]|nr:hypothetical protein [Chthonomonadales bacterium]